VCPPLFGALNTLDAEQPPRRRHRHAPPPRALQPHGRALLACEPRHGGARAVARLQQREDSAELPRARRLAPG